MAVCRQTERGADIRSIAGSLNTMSSLLYEVKAETPLGKTLKALINLCRHHGKTSVNETPNLSGISFQRLALLAGVSEAELRQSLDYLHRNGIIDCSHTNKKASE